MKVPTSDTAFKALRPVPVWGHKPQWLASVWKQVAFQLVYPTLISQPKPLPKKKTSTL